MDVEQLLTWRCVRQRHGVTAHVVVIIVGSVLKAALPDFMMRQAKLISLKLAIVPLLFHGAPPLPSLAARHNQDAMHRGLPAAPASGGT